MKDWVRGVHEHGLVDFVHGQVAVDLLQSIRGVLHGDDGLVVDVGRFDRVYLLLQHGDLAVCLFEGLFVLLLALQCISCRCSIR